MNDIISKIITVMGVETKLTATGKTMLKITDQENKHYQIWKSKQDGTDSVAYSRLQELGDPVGKTIEIGYKEDTGDFQGKAVTYKTIVNIKSANGQQPTRANLMVKAQMSEASRKNTDEKWDEINEKKEKGMRWMNALNNATLLVANGKVELKDLKFQANLIYQITPLDGQQEVLEVDEPLEWDSKIDTSKIPF